jgi:hypothetical protein
MKKVIFAICMIFSTHAFAEAAQELVCNGVDKITKKPVEFQVEFTDSAPGVGFTNMQAIVTKIDGKELKSVVTFQMFEANEGNKCKKNGMGETLYPDALKFDNDDNATLNVSCGDGQNFDVAASCKDLF